MLESCGRLQLNIELLIDAAPAHGPSQESKTTISSENVEVSSVSLPSGHQHFPGLDTLRSVAILIVIPWHAMGWIHNPPLRGFGRYGWCGVDLFFVLSGFLIGSQLFQMIQKEGCLRFGHFYFKRSLRILPAYWVVLLLYVLWPEFREAPKFGPPWRFLLFIANLPLIGKAFSHAWSLCVEEHFYLLFPLIVAWYAGRKRALKPFFVVCVLMIGGAILRFYLWSIFSEDGTREKWDFWNFVYYPSYCRLDGLVVGVSTALVREFRHQAWERVTRIPWFIFGWGILLIVAGLLAFDGDKQMMASVFAFPLVSLGFGALVIVAMSEKFWLSQWKIPGTAMIATAAYTIYLTHKQMIHMATKLVDQPEDHPFTTVGLALGLVVLASVLLHFGVERPGLLLRDRFVRRWNT